MAFKLSKEDEKQRAALIEALNEGRDALEAAIERFNDGMQELRETLTDAQQDYINAISEAKAFIEEKATDWQNEHDEKSEKWQEGEKGQAVSEWIENWRSADYSFDEPEIDIPEDISYDLSNLGEQLDELPSEPE